MSDTAQRTEKPTPRRLDQAYKEGRFPISRELISSVVLTGYALSLAAFGSSWSDALQSVMELLLKAAFTTDLSPRTVAQLCYWALERSMLPFLLCGIVVATLALVAQLASTQMRLPGRFRIDWTKLSPIQRIKGLGGQNRAAVVYSGTLLAVVAWVLWNEVHEKAAQFLALTQVSFEAAGAFVSSSLMNVIWRVTALTAVIGLVDVVRQRAKFMKSLKMTKHEIREEAKDQEGNPQVKRKIRRLQRDMSKRRMMQAVPTATAVIVNPTHFAVAIRYKADSSGAPQVVAKGKDLIALRIRELAIRNQVPVVENPLLARAMYASVEVGQEIPGHLYRAVAEILAYIYRLTGGVVPG